MASPAVMAGVGIGSTVLSGVTGAVGAEQKAQGAQLGIQGQILNTVGQVFGLQTQAEQYQYSSDVNTYQAGVAAANRDLATQTANWEIAAGEVKAQTRGMQEHQDVSKATAIQAASGLDLRGGSSENVRTSIVAMGKFDQDTIRNNAARTAYNYQIQAFQDDAQSKLFTFGAAQDQVQKANTLTAAGLAEEAIPLEEKAYSLAGSAGDTAAFGSIVGAAGSVASKWSEASKLGMFS